MKKHLLTAAVLFFSLPVIQAQTVIWSETFDGATPAWTLNVSTGTNDPTNSNVWFINDNEGGVAPPGCGVGGNGNKTLHVGCQGVFCIGTGAAYNAGDGGLGFANSTTNKRAEYNQPIVTTGLTNLTLSFDWIGVGEVGDDFAKLQYSTNGGTTWTDLQTFGGGATCISGQGQWANFSTVLPAACENQADLRFAFNWQNSNNGSGSDPSFAVNDMELTIPSTGTPPVASFTPSQTTICENDCINFTNTSAGGPFTNVSWSFPGSSTPTSTSANPTNICYPTAGTYSVTLTVTSANGTDDSTMTNVITVNTCASPPVASFSPSQTTICENDCINFTNTSTGGPFTNVSWSFPGSSTPTSTSANPTNICYPTAGTYSVTLTVTSANGTDDSTMTNVITVNTCASPPVANFSASATTICAGGSVTFTDLSTNGPNSWSWTFPGGNPGSSTIQNPTVTYTTPGTYSVTLSATNPAGTDDTTFTNYIIVQNCPAPTAGMNVSQTSICSGDCITIADNSTGATSWAWSFAGGTPSNSTSQNPGSVCFNNPGTYDIQLIATNASGSDTITQQVVVGTPVTVLASPDTTINLGSTIDISAVGSGSGTYSWSNGSAGSTISVSPSGTTAFIVTYSEGGCSATDTVLVNVLIVEGIGVPNAFSPNGDGLNEVIGVQGSGITQMHFRIFNRYGQLVFESYDQADTWDGTHGGKRINSGVFAFVLEYTLISGESGTLKGNITLIK